MFVLPFGVPGVGLLGTLAAWLAGLVGGGTAAMRQYTLRMLLVRAGATPRPYVHFLNEASDNLLLRRAGGGYRFPHRFLQERWATYPPAAPVAPRP